MKFYFINERLFGSGIRQEPRQWFAKIYLGRIIYTDSHFTSIVCCTW